MSLATKQLFRRLAIAFFSVFSVDSIQAFAVELSDYDIDQHVEFDNRVRLNDADIGLSCINGLILHPSSVGFKLIEKTQTGTRTVYDNLNCSQISSSNPNVLNVSCKFDGAEVLNVTPRARAFLDEVGQTYYKPGSYIKIGQPVSSRSEAHTYCVADRFYADGSPKRSTQKVQLQCSAYSTSRSPCDVNASIEMNMVGTPHFQDRIVDEKYLYALDGFAQVVATVRDTGVTALDRTYSIKSGWSRFEGGSRVEVDYAARRYSFSEATYRLSSDKRVVFPNGGFAPTLGFTTFGGLETRLYVRPNSLSDVFDKGMCGAGPGPDRFLSPSITCELRGSEISSGQ